MPLAGVIARLERQYVVSHLSDKPHAHLHHWIIEGMAIILSEIFRLCCHVAYNASACNWTC